MLLSFSGHQGQYTGHQDSRPVWKFYSVAILKFQITEIQNSNNILKKPNKTMDILIHDSGWRKGAFEYYFKFIANFTNHAF